MVLVPGIALVVWWPVPVTVAVAAFALCVGGFAGLVGFGVLTRVLVDGPTVFVRTPLRKRVFPAHQSSARTETTSSLFGTRNFASLVLDRRGDPHYAVRVPLAVFSAPDRARLLRSVSDALHAGRGGHIGS
jgi:hypothetical protein